MSWCEKCVRKGTELCNHCLGGHNAKGEEMTPTKFMANDDYLEPIKFEDEINRPSHYHKGGIDVVGFLEQHYGNKKHTVAEGFAIGCIHKYVARYKEKGGMKDLQKAEFYVKKLMEYEHEEA